MGSSGIPDDGLPFHLTFADSCIGGSTVASSFARTHVGRRAFFLADYAVNPLGIRPKAGVRAALDRWVDAARARSSTLVVACNTASVLLRETPEVLQRAAEVGMTVHSMADLFEGLLRRRAGEVAGKRVCLMGTEFTVGRPLYRNLLEGAGATEILPLPATRTEGTIARLQHGSPRARDVIVAEIGAAVRASDSVVLACTCFPLVADLVRTLHPDVALLDPAEGLDDLAIPGRGGGPNRLTIAVTGNVVTPEEVGARAPDLFPGWVVEEIHSL